MAKNTAPVVNTFRLSVRYVGFQTRRAQYQVHINCPCNLKKSLYGVYGTEQECRGAVPSEAPAHTCPKSTPVVPEKTTPVKPGRRTQRSSKARFIKELTDLVRGDGADGEPLPVSQARTLSTGHFASIERNIDGTPKALVVKNKQGSFFDFRCPFTVRNAGQVAAQIWTLMQTMGL